MIIGSFRTKARLFEIIMTSKLLYPNFTPNYRTIRKWIYRLFEYYISRFAQALDLSNENKFINGDLKVFINLNLRNIFDLRRAKRHDKSHINWKKLFLLAKLAISTNFIYFATILIPSINY